MLSDSQVPRRALNLMTVMAPDLVVQKVAGDLPVPNARNVLQAPWAQLDLPVPGIEFRGIVGIVGIY